MFEPAPSSDVLACLFCGQPEHAEIFEVWGHEFMLHLGFSLWLDETWGSRQPLPHIAMPAQRWGAAGGFI